MKFLNGRVVCGLLCLAAIGLVGLWGGYVLRRGPLLALREIPQRPPLIAHAGGAIKADMFYTNSLEALEQNYSQGFRYFELDFNWTRDYRLVCIHDWDATYTQYFLDPPPAPPTYDEFLQLKMTRGLNQLTLESVMAWLSSKPDAVIVTDIKVDNIEGLTVLRNLYPERQHQVIAQVYEPAEISPVRMLGFENIILTLYRCPLSRRELLSLIGDEQLFAITVPRERVKRWGFAKNLSRGFFVYTHTINSHKDFESLKAFGVNGVYTDTLVPSAAQSTFPEP